MNAFSVHRINEDTQSLHDHVWQNRGIDLAPDERGGAFNTWGRHGAALSCRFPTIVTQESTKPLTLLYSSSHRFHRHDQPVSKTLMVSFHVIVVNKLTNGIPQRISVCERRLGQKSKERG